MWDLSSLVRTLQQDSVSNQDLPGQGLVSAQGGHIDVYTKVFLSKSEGCAVKILMLLAVERLSLFRDLCKDMYTYVPITREIGKMEANYLGALPK